MAKIVKFVLIALIKLYRAVISPLLPPACRFYPTCSEYAILALEKYGVFRASYLIIRRILRCNPFCKGGYDPV